MHFKTIVSLSLLWMACKQPEAPATVASQADSSVAAPAALDLNGYSASYSSSFVIGDAKNVKTLMTLYKDFDEGNLSAHADLMADSMELNFADGSTMRAPKDSVLKGVIDYRNSFSKVTTTIDAIVPIKSTDHNDQFVVVWQKVVRTSKKGVTDSVYQHETWLFNKDGKAAWTTQFEKPAAVAKK